MWIMTTMYAIQPFRGLSRPIQICNLSGAGRRPPPTSRSVERPSGAWMQYEKYLDPNYLGRGRFLHRTVPSQSLSVRALPHRAKWEFPFEIAAGLILAATGALIMMEGQLAGRR